MPYSDGVAGGVVHSLVLLDRLTCISVAACFVLCFIEMTATSVVMEE